MEDPQTPSMLALPRLRCADREREDPLPRRIADLCATHSAYRWWCGGVQVNPHTLSDFYTDHSEWLDQQFTLH